MRGNQTYGEWKIGDPTNDEWMTGDQTYGDRMTDDRMTDDRAHGEWKIGDRMNDEWMTGEWKIGDRVNDEWMTGVVEHVRLPVIGRRGELSGLARHGRTHRIAMMNTCVDWGKSIVVSWSWIGKSTACCDMSTKPTETAIEVAAKAMATIAMPIIWKAIATTATASMGTVTNRAIGDVASAISILARDTI